MAGFDRLIGQIGDMDRRLRAIESTPQLTNSSLDDGSLTVYDAEGNLAGRMGKQPDGSFAPYVAIGPTPATPTDIEVVGSAGSVTVRWDGTFRGNAPMDFHQIAVHASTEPYFEPSAENTVATFNAVEASTRTLTSSPGTFYFKATCLSIPGRRSGATDEALAEVLPLVDEDSIKAALAAERTAREEADQGMSDELDARLEGLGEAQAALRVEDEAPTSDTPGAMEGAIWWQADAEDRIIGQWTWDGAAWQRSTLDHEVIGSVDVGSLRVGGTALIDEAVIGKLWADGIAAKSLQASRLVVPSSNVIPDGDRMETDEQWAPLVRDTDDTPDGAVASLRLDVGGDYSAAGSVSFPVDSDQEYLAEVWVRASHDGTALTLPLVEPDGTDAGVVTVSEPSEYTSGSALLLRGNTVPTTWTRYRGIFTPGEGVSEVRLQGISATFPSGAGADHHVWLAKPTLRPKVGAVLIENGAVSTEHLAAGSITGEKIAALSIDAGHIKAHAIKADMISGGAFTGETFEGGTFTGGLFKTSDALPGKIVLSDDAFTEVINNAVSPGIRIEPASTDSIEVFPGIGPSSNGIILSGGEDVDGNWAFMSADPEYLRLSKRTFDGASSLVAVSDRRVGLQTSLNGEGYGTIAVTPSDSSITSKSSIAGGTGGTVQVSHGNAKLYAFEGTTTTASVSAQHGQAELLARSDNGDTRSISVENSGVVLRENGWEDIDLTAVYRSLWQDVSYPSGMYHPHGAPLQRQRVGKRVYWRGRLAFTDGRDFANQEANILFTLSSAWRPQYTTGLLTPCQGSNQARIEVSGGSGQISVRPTNGNTSWVSLDGLFYDLP